VNEIRIVGKAWLTGAVIILLIVVGDALLRQTDIAIGNWLLYAVWGSFMLAVYLTARFAPRHKLITAMSHTLTISFLFALSNLIRTALGISVDLGGERGFGIVFALVYVTSFIPALIAATVGMIVSGRGEESA
jgi:hypothetical protein